MLRESGQAWGTRIERLSWSKWKEVMVMPGTPKASPACASALRGRPPQHTFKISVSRRLCTEPVELRAAVHTCMPVHRRMHRLAPPAPRHAAPPRPLRAARAALT